VAFVLFGTGSFGNVEGKYDSEWGGRVPGLTLAEAIASWWA
jgi:hypothetical protein